MTFDIETIFELRRAIDETITDGSRKVFSARLPLEFVSSEGLDGKWCCLEFGDDEITISPPDEAEE